MVKVLMINYEYPPLGGGTAIANEYLIKEFKKIKNIKVDVLTSSPNNFSEQSFTNIRLIRLNIGKNKQNLHHQNYWNLFRFFLTSTTWTLVHRQNYDLIHAFSGLPGSITAFLSGKPYLISFRGADEPGYEQRHEFFWKLIKPMMCFIYNHARSLDANSQYLKKLVLKSFPNLKIKIIQNGVDSTKFYPTKKIVTKPIILCTSRLAERKGVEYLIQAMTSIPKAKLLLVGSGILESKMKLLVKKLHLSARVKFLGTVLHNRLPSIYRQAKLFVLPSLSESLSNSLLEALACGLPVVATNIGGNSEIIHNQNGSLVPPKNSKALSQAIIKLLNSRFKFKSSEIYSWEKSAKKYYQLYSQPSA